MPAREEGDGAVDEAKGLATKGFECPKGFIGPSPADCWGANGFVNFAAKEDALEGLSRGASAKGLTVFARDDGDIRETAAVKLEAASAEATKGLAVRLGCAVLAVAGRGNAGLKGPLAEALCPKAEEKGFVATTDSSVTVVMGCGRIRGNAARGASVVVLANGFDPKSLGAGGA